MSWIIFCVLCFAGCFIGFGFCNQGNRWIWKVNKKQWLSAASLIFVVFSLVTIIPANSVGILYSPFNGGVQDRILTEGVQAKSPFDTVYVINTEVQTKHIEDLYGQTKDSQYLTIEVDIKYYINKEKAFDVFKKFKTLDNVDTALISPSVQRAIEDSMIKYNIIEILGESRSNVYRDVEMALNERLNTNGITLHSITFLDTDAGDAIEKAIQDEAIAKKAVETAEQKRLAAEIDAKTRIIAAEAEAEEKRILAAAISKDPAILELEWIKKWNGQLPEFVGDGDGIMINLGDLAK